MSLSKLARFVSVVGVVCCLACIVCLAVARPAQAHLIERLSVDGPGMPGNGQSFAASISADGRFVAYASQASNLVSGDTNGWYDVFVYDRSTGETARVSLATAGTQANGPSFRPSISGDGRYVTFESEASNLVAGDTNGVVDVFVHDRDTGATTRVSVDSVGAQGNGGASDAPAISGDGRYVAFQSLAGNLVSGDSNGTSDVFVHDRNTGQTTRASVGSAGVQGNTTSSAPAISADGRYVAFESDATNLVGGDANGSRDVFVRDRTGGTTTRVSVGSAGGESESESTNASISADGRWVAFRSAATNLVPGDTNSTWDIFLHDRDTGATTRVSVHSTGTEANGQSSHPVVSADGSFVAFESEATNLVPGDGNGVRDVFVHERSAGLTTRVSVDSMMTEGNGSSRVPAISADAGYVAFESDATNLVSAGDTNSGADVFVRDRVQSETTQASVGNGGIQGNGGSMRSRSAPTAATWPSYLLPATSCLGTPTQMETYSYTTESPGPTPW